MINNLKRLGIAATAVLSLYGAGRIGSDVYNHFKPEQVNEERYILSLMYYHPERRTDNTVPGSIILTRARDSRLLWSAIIKTYPDSHRPYVDNVWSDQELSDKLDGELTFDIIGSPN